MVACVSLHRSESVGGWGLLCVGHELAFISHAKIATLGLVPEAQKDQLKIAFVVDTPEQAEGDDRGFQIAAAQPDCRVSDFVDSQIVAAVATLVDEPKPCLLPSRPQGIFHLLFERRRAHGGGPGDSKLVVRAEHVEVPVEAASARQPFLDHLECRGIGNRSSEKHGHGTPKKGCELGFVNNGSLKRRCQTHSMY